MYYNKADHLYLSYYKNYLLLKLFINFYAFKPYLIWGLGILDWGLGFGPNLNLSYYYFIKLFI